MSWYQTSQAMFKTFGLETKLAHTFLKNYEAYYRKNRKNPKEANKKFHEQGVVNLGYYKLSDGIKPIIDYYGKPSMELPELIYFCIARPNIVCNQLGNIDFGAFLGQKDDFFVIGNVMENAMDFKNDYDDFKDAIAHELQHFLKTLYGNRTLHYAPTHENLVISYYSEPFEVQSHSHDIAKRAMQDIRDLFDFRIQNAPSNKKQEIVTKVQNNKDSLIKKFFIPELKNFFRGMSEEAKTELPEDIRRQYYISALKNFNVFFDQFIKEISD